jgi:predicted GNAT family N-acyltransferase
MTDSKPSNAPSYQIESADWSRYAATLYVIRYQVFVVEQQVPVELERDAYDPISQHVLARTTDGQPIGTGRLLPDGHIGRLAVLAEWRSRGVGRALMQALLDRARESQFATVELNAQTTAIAFYAGLGFCVAGAEFMEAGIAHRRMFLNL